jgi:hypothetical protein
MEVTFSTADVHRRDRLDYWRVVACRAFVDLECHARRSATFSANIRSGPFAELGLSVVESDACVVHRTQRGIARSGEDALLLSLQLEDSSALEQDGREARLGPGDFALYDTRGLTGSRLTPAPRSSCSTSSSGGCSDAGRRWKTRRRPAARSRRSHSPGASRVPRTSRTASGNGSPRRQPSIAASSADNRPAPARSRHAWAA